MSILSDFMQMCLNASYHHVENGGDYAIRREGSTAYLLFQWSNGKEDWKNNFDFFAKPYKDMQVTWRCHRGFLRVWKSIEPYVQKTVLDKRVKHFVIIGYSHGAAIAALAHEYVWFNRPDLHSDVTGSLFNIEGFGFGCPRVFFGRMKKELRKRWSTFLPIRNLNDIVTHVPPTLFGFRHVSPVLTVGHKQWNYAKHSKLSCVNAHYPDNYITSLERTC